MKRRRVTRVLFNWRPRILDLSLKDRFQRRMATAGLRLDLMEIRHPRYSARNAPTYWHKDAEPYPHQRLAVWSNIRSTAIRFPDGDLLQTQDGDVILIDNDEVEHRAPEDHTGRWFIRASVAKT